MEVPCNHETLVKRADKEKPGYYQLRLFPILLTPPDALP